MFYTLCSGRSGFSPKREQRQFLMKQRLMTIVAGSIVLIGIVLVGWVITEFVGGDLEVGSKYSHAAKNSNLLLLGLFVGLAATAYGLFTLAINRRDNNDR